MQRSATSWKRTSITWLIVLPTLLVCSCEREGSAQQTASLPPSAESLRPSFLRPPELLRGTGRSIELAGRCDPSAGRRQTWLVAVPPGELELQFQSIDLLHHKTGEPIRVDSKGELAHLRNLASFQKAFLAEDLGTLRRSRLYRIRLDRDIWIPWKEEGANIEGFHVTISFPRVQEPDIADTGFSDKQSGVRQLAELSVANPEWIAAYADARPSVPRPALAPPSDWQPRPELPEDGQWLKFAVREEGLYAIDRDWLEQTASLEAADLDRIGIFCRGRRVSVLRRMGLRGDVEALLFWGQANPSYETRERVYYAAAVPRRGERVIAEQKAPAGTAGLPLRFTYRRRARIEQDNHLKTAVGDFLSIQSMTWVWEELDPNGETEFTFSVPSLAEPSGACTGDLLVYHTGEGFAGQRRFRVVLNGVPVAEASLPEEAGRIRLDIPPEVLVREDNRLRIAVETASDLEAQEWPELFLDAMELEYDSLIAPEDGTHLMELLPDRDTAAGTFVAKGFEPSSLLILDVTDADSPAVIPHVGVPGGASFSIDPAGTRRVMLCQGEAVVTAPPGQLSKWQDWRRPAYSADVLIVTHALFRDQAERLAADIRTTGREVLVADVESLYEAYNYGELSVDAIRAFVADSVHTWEGRRPTHLLLIGDCTSDGRNRARNDVVNYVPTYRPPPDSTDSTDSKADYCTDQYFAWVCGEDEIADLIVGRLSVANERDAQVVVEKTMEYRREDPAPWTGRMLNITDPGEFHDVSQRLLAEAVDPWLNVRTIHTAEYPWEDNFYLPVEAIEGEEVKVSPRVTAEIAQQIDEGAGLVTFFGHGSPNIWSNQRIWFGGDSENSDNLRLDNRERLAFMASFTCNNGAIDYPVPRWNVCIAEDMMRVPNGGVVGCFVPAGPGFSHHHLALSEGFFQGLTAMGIREVGQLAELARLRYQATWEPDEHARMFITMGDPTLSLAIPRPDLELQVFPERLRDSPEEQKVRLRVRGPEPLVSGQALLLGHNGREIATGDLAPNASGELEGEVAVTPEVSALAYQLIAGARAESGTYHQTGRRISVGPGEVLITSFRSHEDLEAGTVDLIYELENRDSFPQEGELAIRIVDEDGEAELEDVAFSLQGGETKRISRKLMLWPGIHVFEARVHPTRSRFLLPGKPSAHSFDAVVSGLPSEEAMADLRLAGGGLRLLRPASRGAGPPGETFAANIGGLDVDASVRWIVSGKEGEILGRGSKWIGSMPAGEARRIEVPLLRSGEWPDSGVAEVLLEPRSEDSVTSSPARRAYRLRSFDLPDLVFVRDSLTVRPSHIAQGATVFVEGMVTNEGRSLSVPVEAALYDAEDERLIDPLRSLAGQPRGRVPPLAPGESWPIKLRWDPHDELGEHRIAVVLDADNQSLESSKANNRRELTVDFKTKWRLSPKGMEIRKSEEPGEVILVARLANEGETDAQRVSVFFYRDADQRDEDLLGQVLVDRIEAGTVAYVEYPWRPTQEELEGEWRPSFEVALKGSLQRISSVTEE